MLTTARKLDHIEIHDLLLAQHQRALRVDESTHTTAKIFTNHGSSLVAPPRIIKKRRIVIDPLVHCAAYP